MVSGDRSALIKAVGIAGGVDAFALHFYPRLPGRRGATNAAYLRTQSYFPYWQATLRQPQWALLPANNRLWVTELNASFADAPELVGSWMHGLMQTCGYLKRWLGRQGSNLRMPASKAGALPLGDAPSSWHVLRRKTFASVCCGGLITRVSAMAIAEKREISISRSAEPSRACPVQRRAGYLPVWRAIAG